MENRKEIWKDIEGYESIYKVSNYVNIKSLERPIYRNGKIFCIQKEKILKHSYHSAGYNAVNLYKNQLPNLCLVHRIIAEAFIPNPENKPTINHINGIKSDNRLENLEWSTYSENNQHAYTVLGKKGPFDKIPGNAKLTLNLETGIYYDSIRHASDSLNMNRGTLLSMLNGNNRNRTSMMIV